MSRITLCLKLVTFFGFVFFGQGVLFASTNVPHVFLVQNSGWMLPFYDDPNSKFKELVGELSNRVRKYGESEQIVASFNQSIGTNDSPLLIYRGSDQDLLRKSINSIQLARKPGKQSYADTDFKEAIIGAITKFSPGKSCLIWIITNNKNSPNNSDETNKKNEEFYNFLQASNEIKRIVAFPHQMAVQSQSRNDYKANGLMIYALAYGDPADQLLRQMLKDNVPFGKQPARLKPLNADALTFVPTKVENKNVDVRLGSDHKSLILTFSADSKPEIAILKGQFRNEFFPYDIQNADITIDTEGFNIAGNRKITAELSTKSISNIPAGGMSSDIDVKIKIPAVPSPWDPEVIFGNGYKTKGVIRFNLDNQKLSISKDFSKSMAELFPRDPLPDLFIPGDSAKKSDTDQSLVIYVEYPSFPLIILSIVGLLIGGVVIAGVVIMRREKIYKVSIDGVQKTFGLKPFSAALLKDQNGAKIGVLKRGLFSVGTTLDKGMTNSVRVM